MPRPYRDRHERQDAERRKQRKRESLEADQQYDERIAKIKAKYPDFDWNSPPAKASKYILSLDEYKRRYPKNKLLICYGRASTYYGQSVEEQLDGSRQRLKDADMVPSRKEFGDVCSGRSMKERHEFKKAVELAKRKGLPVAICLPNTSRLIRHPLFHPYLQPNERPTVAQFEEIMEMADGVPIVVLSNPNSSPIEDQQFLKELCEEGRCRKSRRCTSALTRKERKKTYISTVVRLRKRGMSYGDIRHYLFRRYGVEITKMTLRKWVSAA